MELFGGRDSDEPLEGWWKVERWGLNGPNGSNGSGPFFDTSWRASSA